MDAAADDDDDDDMARSPAVMLPLPRTAAAG
jgi:hypothetical protein